jgi:hypothetical protein
VAADDSQRPPAVGIRFDGAQVGGDVGMGNISGRDQVTTNISGIDGRDALAFIREYIVLLDQARNRVDEELREGLKDALAELARLGRDVARDHAALRQELWITRLVAVVAMVTALIAIGLGLR